MPPSRYPVGRMIIGVALALVVLFNFQLSSDVAYTAEPHALPVPKPRESPSLRKSQLAVQSLRLPTPVFVVGLPKVGTSSIHAMFACSGVSSSHFCCSGSNRTHTHCNDGGQVCAGCIRANIKAKRPILQGCGDYSVYAQMDAELGKGMFLPQRFHLDKLHEYAPNATFVLNLRPAQDWVDSVTNWFGLGARFLTTFHIDHRTVQHRHQVLRDIFNNHTQYVRDFVNQQPAHRHHRLVEVDITSPTAGKVLADAFGIHESCWGKHNQNKKKNGRTHFKDK